MFIHASWQSGLFSDRIWVQEIIQSNNAECIKGSVQAKSTLISSDLTHYRSNTGDGKGRGECLVCKLSVKPLGPSAVMLSVCTIALMHA